MLVRFYLPDDCTNFECLYEHCIDRIGERFGGCTVTTGLGLWYNPNTGERVREAVHMLEVYCTLDRDDTGLWFDRLADYVRREGKQDSVLYVVFGAVTGRMVGAETIIGGERA